MLPSGVYWEFSAQESPFPCNNSSTMDSQSSCPSSFFRFAFSSPFCCCTSTGVFSPVEGESAAARDSLSLDLTDSTAAAGWALGDTSICCIGLLLEALEVPFVAVGFGDTSIWGNLLLEAGLFGVFGTFSGLGEFVFGDCTATDSHGIKIRDGALKGLTVTEARSVLLGRFWVTTQFAEVKLGS
jgi:hypothetical protein